MAVTGTKMDQTITLTERPKAVRRISTKEAALRMLHDLAAPTDDTA